jgi:hypothetical protein
MSYELAGIIILGVTQTAGLVYLSREFREQLKLNVALQTQFQKWNAEQFGNISQRLDQILDMLRSR